MVILNRIVHIFIYCSGICYNTYMSSSNFFSFIYKRSAFYKIAQLARYFRFEKMEDNFVINQMTEAYHSLFIIASGVFRKLILMFLVDNVTNF